MIIINSNTEVKISIIVPIYNSEKYLKKCIDSLLNQKLKEIEIILIDDCSTDDSRRIINDYAIKNPDRLVFEFLNKNQGQVHARNIGIEKASGEYILFVDSDDYIDLAMCECLYEELNEEKYDIICFDIFKIINNKRIEKKLDYDKSINGIIDENKREKLFNSSGYFSTRMYKRKMLIDNNIRFPEKINYEDSLFNTLTLLYAQSVAKIDKPLYYYVIREGSNSNCYNENRLYDRIKVNELMIQEVKKRNIYNQNRDIIDMKYFKMTVGNIHLCLDMFKEVNFEKLKEIANSVNYNYEDYRTLKCYRNLDKVSKGYISLNAKFPKSLVLIDRIYKNILKMIKK